MGLPNIGPLELIIVLAIALLIVGPGKLPEMGSALGRTIREFRKSASGLSDITESSETEPQSSMMQQAPTPLAAYATPHSPPLEPEAVDVAPASDVAALATSAMPVTGPKTETPDDSA